MTDDLTQRFLFEEADIRGEAVQLETSYGEILAIHQYSPGVCRLLGEFLAAAVLLSSNLKYEGKLILQARSEGQVPLLMAECDHTLNIRGIVRGAQYASSGDEDQLLPQGQLAITIDPVRGQRYQGIVPLEQDSLARSLVAYFEHSEQLHTRIWLAAEGGRAGGLLLQQLPAQVAPEEATREAQWEHACTLADTVSKSELLDTSAADLLHRLFHEDPVRLFEPAAVSFRCSCSRQRTLDALASIGAPEVAELLAERGSISMDCEFCNQQYLFEPADLESILREPGSKTVH